MSSGLGFTTILGCLSEGEKVAGLNSKNWRLGGGKYNLGQSMFLDDQDYWRKGLLLFSDEKLRSYATYVHADILEKMKEWKMRLDKLPDGGLGALYMISQLRELLSWQKPGKRVVRQWPEFVLEDGVSFYTVGMTERVVVNVQLTGGDQVFMTRFAGETKGYDLYLAVKGFDGYLVPAPHIGYFSVQIPCVFADIEADLSWLLGMRNSDFYISYAQQKILFGVNENGFAVREETGMTMKLMNMMSPPLPYILSPNGESFLFWRRRPGVDFPVSMFLFTKDDFKDPGDLNRIVA